MAIALTTVATVCAGGAALLLIRNWTLPKLVPWLLLGFYGSLVGVYVTRRVHWAVVGENVSTRASDALIAGPPSVVLLGLFVGAVVLHRRYPSP